MKAIGLFPPLPAKILRTVNQIQYVVTSCTEGGGKWIYQKRLTSKSNQSAVYLCSMMLLINLLLKLLFFLIKKFNKKEELYFCFFGLKESIIYPAKTVAWILVRLFALEAKLFVWLWKRLFIKESCLGFVFLCIWLTVIQSVPTWLDTKPKWKDQSVNLIRTVPFLSIL